MYCWISLERYSLHRKDSRSKEREGNEPIKARYCSQVERNNSEWMSLNGNELNLENLFENNAKEFNSIEFTWEVIEKKMFYKLFV